MKRSPRKPSIVRVTLLVMLAALLAVAVPALTGAPTATVSSAELVRLHVIANSDAPADQKAKLEVRSALLATVEAELAPGGTAAETLAYFRKHRERLEEMAERTLAAVGNPDDVQLVVGQHWFPEKSTGGVVVPAGTYQSVRVIIGKGEGHNWWCILFPQACFAAEDATPQQIHALLDEAGVLGTGRPIVDEEALGPVEYRLRLKVLDLFGRVPRRVGSLDALLSWLK